MKKYTRGFTLIELLVVIAIIGILSSVVLASLNSARTKGNAAKIKAQLAGLRAGAEVFYDNNTQTYTGLCTTSDTAVAPYLSATNYPSGTTFDCGASASAYSEAASGSGTIWCVDSTGASRDKTSGGTAYTALTGAATAAHTAAGATVCN